jgi:hypothetical protein
MTALSLGKAGITASRSGTRSATRKDAGESGLRWSSEIIGG